MMLLFIVTVVQPLSLVTVILKKFKWSIREVYVDAI